MISEVCREVVQRPPRPGAYPPTTSWSDLIDHTAAQLRQLLRSSQLDKGAPKLAGCVSKILHEVGLHEITLFSTTKAGGHEYTAKPALFEAYKKVMSVS